MNNTYILVGRWLIVAALMALPLSCFGQEPKHSDKSELNCSECHTCKVPTMRQPCLKACPRTIMVNQTSEHSMGEAPDSILMDELADVYHPVKFQHKLHAGMAEMGHDCATCHHFSPPGIIPACKECHGMTAQSSDLRKPNLKGAYHRQCLSCHIEWSHESKCTVCHLLARAEVTKSGITDPTDILGRSHPALATPVTRTYRTPYEPGPVVTFQHKEHTDLFGFKCVNCHREENCNRCHDWQKTSVAPKTQKEVHAVCNNCHVNDSCAMCHDRKERSGFSHNTTGWPLNPYHRKLQCWSCHPKATRMAKVDKMCASCHENWNQDNFRHAVTGLKLDDTHSQLDCTDCHTNRKYEEDPVCSNCHDDGRTADKAIPGTKMK